MTHFVVRHWLGIVSTTSALLVLHATGCILDREGLLDEGSGAGTACSSGADCEVSDLCTNGQCSSEGVCVRDPLPDDTQLPQESGDCVRLVCRSGVETNVPDDADVPQMECLTATCSTGEAILEPQASGVPCSNGHCDGEGACVPDCRRPDDDVCDDDNVCTLDSCDVGAGLCFHEASPDGTAPLDAQVDGDCLKLTCDAGVPTHVVDRSDVPPVVTTCMVGTCDESGDPGSSPAQDGAPCDDGNLCTAGETCSSGVCGGGSDPCAVACGDTNCQDACNPATGACDAFQPAGFGCVTFVACNDACNGEGSCE